MMEFKMTAYVFRDEQSARAVREVALGEPGKCLITTG
jgi:hypothetical protein